MIEFGVVEAGEGQDKRKKWTSVDRRNRSAIGSGRTSQGAAGSRGRLVSDARPVRLETKQQVENGWHEVLYSKQALDLNLNSNCDFKSFRYG